ncbi:CLUMA_CG011535, isoform A [Clunio marinus]|uniref:CLUMA_CG011535, isoform A n=1 Tax=Clunio marinus TaxID=568069 RepID=A0A1J1II90_9DIPT|nr:CLUMA_CG011535, isoform A [Clunio marinus]
MLSLSKCVFLCLIMLITIKMASCIVNRPPDNNNNNNDARKKETLNLPSVFNRFKKQNFESKDYKNHYPHLGSLWASPGQFPLFTFSHPNPANINNLVNTENDNVDVNGVAQDVPINSATGYVFQKPTRIKQSFKTFGIKLGKVGSLYGTGAYFSHQDYPHEIR